MEKLYSIRELSENKDFPYKEASIRKFIKDGKLKTIRFSRQKIRITAGEINRFLNSLHG